MKSKICLVTGASSGIGKATTEILTEMGANVIMVSRSTERGEQAYKKISKKTPEKVEWITADLSLMSSVRELAEVVNNKYESLDLLINCAGVQLIERIETAEGLEKMLATNYLSCFLLTNLLKEILLNGFQSKVIIVSGSGHKPKAAEGLNKAVIDFEDLQGKKRFSFPKASKQAVLAKIILAYELSRRWQNSGIEVCTVCPGLTKTNLVHHLPWYIRLFMAVRFALSNAQEPREGAAHLIKLANMTGVNGKYYEGGREGLFKAVSTEESYNRETASRLWAVSEELVGENF